MVTQPDFILYQPTQQPIQTPPAAASGRTPKLYPLTHGVWQRETLDTLKMYAPGEGGFSPTRGSAPDQGAASMEGTCGSVALGPDDPSFAGVPHRNDLRFFATDTLPFVRHTRGHYRPCVEAVPSVPGGKPSDAIELTGGSLYDPARTELKADQFPDRLIYMDGGLYPPGSKDDPQVAQAHENAPNYRKMPRQARARGRAAHETGIPRRARPPRGARQACRVDEHQGRGRHVHRWQALQPAGADGTGEPRSQGGSDRCRTGSP